MLFESARDLTLAATKRTAAGRNRYLFGASFTDAPFVGNFVGNIVGCAFADKVRDKVSDKDGTRRRCS